MSYIKVEDLSLGYDSEIVCSNINFEINKNDYLCIIGENGAGKSTLIKTILDLKEKKAGKILFSENLKKSEIGYLPQQTVVQKDFPTTVYEVVLSGMLSQLKYRPFYTKKKKNMQNKKWKNWELHIYKIKVIASYLVDNNNVFY